MDNLDHVLKLQSPTNTWNPQVPGGRKFVFELTDFKGYRQKKSSGGLIITVPVLVLVDCKTDLEMKIQMFCKEKLEWLAACTAAELYLYEVKVLADVGDVHYVCNVHTIPIVDVKDLKEVLVWVYEVELVDRVLKAKSRKDNSLAKLGNLLKLK